MAPGLPPRLVEAQDEFADTGPKIDNIAIPASQIIEINDPEGSHDSGHGLFPFQEFSILGFRCGQLTPVPQDISLPGDDTIEGGIEQEGLVQFRLRSVQVSPVDILEREVLL